MPLSPRHLFAVLLPCALAAVSTASAAAPLHVARIFGDHMVLQQQLPIPVWGTSEPGAQIHVALAGATADTTATADGQWKLKLPALPAGGPYEMTVSGPAPLVFHDVMIGEVWLTSGQSNMDFRLKSATGAPADIAAADFPQIRYLRVEQVLSRTPRADLDAAAWETCSLATAGEFSAVAFYFARELHRQRHVAVGIVNASWSGTPAEAWTSAKMLGLHPDFRDRIAQIATSTDDWTAGEKETERLALVRESLFTTSTAGPDRGVHRPDFDDRSWSSADYPLDVVTMHQPEYSMLWLRKTVDLPPAAAGRDLTLNLGQVYEWDQTYFNGEKIGSTRWDGARVYSVPGRLVRAGHNVIAVHLFSEWWAGQLGKRLDRPTLASADGAVSVSLAGPWRYDGRFEPKLPVGHLYQNEPTGLFNGLIAPVIPYAIRGALWYQGEGNAGNPLQYQTLLPALIMDWRARWEEGHFPFLVVQLPNIDAGIGRNWPALREAQAMATRYPNVGLAVTIDVGDPSNIHPANKRPVGERLYGVARHVAYGESGPWTGPVFRSVAPIADRHALRVNFAEATGGLVTSDGAAARGFELRGRTGDYVPADARIEGDSVVVSSAHVRYPTALRYAWAANPAGNLANRTGLPAAPFRTE